MSRDDASLEAELMAKNSHEVPQIHRDGMDAEQGEIELEDRDPRGIWGPGQGDTHKAYIVHVPYTGDHDFFQLRPNPFDIVGYQAAEVEVSGNEVQLTYILNSNAKQNLESDLAKIELHLDRLRANAKPYQDQLLPIIKSAIAGRRAEVGADDALMNDIGIKIRERPGAPRTYVVPDIRPKIAPVVPSGGGGSKPDPTLDPKIYERIIQVCKGMAHVMERTPSAFVGMDEEALRTHFLVQLNGQFEGGASGETFNSLGKTDILVRVNDANLFIGECKFWDGAAALNHALGQILDYTTWRDTKTAIIMFNRNKDFSAVVGKSRETMEQHPNFKRGPLLAEDEGTETRWVFRHKNDAERELTVTVLLFDVPTEA